MNDRQVDNNGNGNADNIGLNNAEINALMANALNVPGSAIDPENVFEPGKWVAMRLVDQNPDKLDRAYLDLASVKVAVDHEGGEVHIGQQLMGLIPEDFPSDESLEDIAPSYAFLADTDNDQDTGAFRRQLEELGIPSKFDGADLIALAQVVDEGEGSLFIDGRAWNVITTDGGEFRELVELDPDLFQLQLHTLRMHPHFALSTNR
jgi:hypothetical protein